VRQEDRDFEKSKELLSPCWFGWITISWTQVENCWSLASVGFDLCHSAVLNYGNTKQDMLHKWCYIYQLYPGTFPTPSAFVVAAPYPRGNLVSLVSKEWIIQQLLAKHLAARVFSWWLLDARNRLEREEKVRTKTFHPASRNRAWSLRKSGLSAGIWRQPFVVCNRGSWANPLLGWRWNEGISGHGLVFSLLLSKLFISTEISFFYLKLLR
jgi:hypothetical protein